MTAQPLIVPMDLDALYVNQDVRSDTFHRWTPTFRLWNKAWSPEPDPFTNDSFNKPEKGVYLHWHLPMALRRARHYARTPTSDDPLTSRTEFPPIPNRWLVIRAAGGANDRKLTAWIVASDELRDASTSNGSPFPHPKDPEKAAKIGRRYVLADWAGDAHPPESVPLTAIGPGLLTFSAFQPYNHNVLSMHDELAGVEHPATLSYLVIGWYSDQKSDVLTARSALESLRWTASAGPELNRSLHVGHAVAVKTTVRNAPGSRRPQSGDTVAVAVGNSSIDALSGLLRRVGSIDHEYSALLEALQHGMLDQLDDSGHDSIDKSIHRSWFETGHGGFGWRAVDRTTESRRESSEQKAVADGLDDTRQLDERRAVDAERESLSPAAAAAERTLLDRLNSAQNAHDRMVRELADVRWKLYRAWWLPRRDANPSLRNKFTNALNADQTGSLAARVAELAKSVSDRHWDGTGTPNVDSVPWGDDAKRLAAAVAAYPRQGELAPHRVLQRIPAPEFHQPRDPVVLLAHTGAGSPISPGSAVACRLPSEVVTSSGDLAAIPAEKLVPFQVDKLREKDVIADLVREFWLLDQAKLTEKKVVFPPGKPRPALGATEPWSQPWRPMYLMYDVTYYPIPHSVNDQPCWKFDGSRFSLTTTAPMDGKNYQTYVGRTVLTPHATFNLADRVTQYVRQYRRGHGHSAPDEVEEALNKMVKTISDWKLLSQNLEGLTLHLAERNTGVRARPHGTSEAKVAALISDPPRTLPGPRTVFKGIPQSIRGGQLRFNRLVIVDNFGQSCEAITTAKGGSNNRAKQLGVAPSIAPGERVVGDQWKGTWVQLPPRLFQGARLRFTTGPAGTTGDTSENPVCGWLLPNHLDRGLLVFDPAGIALGETRVVRESSGQEVRWVPAPGSPTPTPESVASRYPYLGRFLQKMRRPVTSEKEATDLAAGAKAHADLLTAIDETLFGVNPLGGWDQQAATILAGRPLALVRANLRFELDGPARFVPTWTNWEAVLDNPKETPAPEFLNHPWSVRLGSLANQEDGLIGYFLNDDYSRLYAVHPESLSSGYVRPIDSGFPLGFAKDPVTATVSMLVDPRAAVHAVTDLLPASVLRVPAAFIDGPLGNLRLFFRLGPVLAGTTTMTDESGNRTSGLVVPRPAAGAWTFHESTGPTAEATIPLAPDGHPAQDRPNVRTGRLFRTQPLL